MISTGSTGASYTDSSEIFSGSGTSIRASGAFSSVLSSSLAISVVASFGASLTSTGASTGSTVGVSTVSTGVCMDSTGAETMVGSGVGVLGIDSTISVIYFPLASLTMMRYCSGAAS